MLDLLHAVLALIVGCALVFPRFRKVVVKAIPGSWLQQCVGFAALIAGVLSVPFGAFGVIYTLSSPWFHRVTVVEAAVIDRLDASAPASWQWFWAREGSCSAQVVVAGHTRAIPIGVQTEKRGNRDYMFARHRGQWFGYDVSTKPTEVGKKDLQDGVDECIQALKAVETSQVAKLVTMFEQIEGQAKANRDSYAGLPPRRS